MLNPTSPAARSPAALTGHAIAERFGGDPGLTRELKAGAARFRAFASRLPAVPSYGAVVASVGRTLAAESSRLRSPAGA